MFDFTWRVFMETGNVDTYLLLKEMEKEGLREFMPIEEIPSEADYPVS